MNIPPQKKEKRKEDERPDQTHDFIKLRKLIKLRDK